MRMFRRTLALLFVACMLVSSIGCDKQVVAPELLQPIESMSALHTVTKMNMESVQIVSGSVVPEVYHMVYDYATTVEKLHVSEGDVVVAGDVLYEQNLEADRQARELEIQIEIKETQHTLDVDNFDDTIAQLKKTMYMFSNMKDYYNSNLMKYQIEELQLNFDRSNAAKLEEIAADKERLEELKEQAAASKVVAPCDGTISYIGISDESNVVDEGKTVLSIVKEGGFSLVSPYIEEEDYAKYSSVKAQIGADMYDVTYVPYTMEELADMNATGGAMHSYYTVEGLKDTVKAGDYVAFYMTTALEEPVLAVPLNAVSKVGKSYYVTVVDGAMQVQREVTIGTSNLNYREIKTGLTEGEVVFAGKDLATYGVEYKTTTIQNGSLSSQVKISGAERYAMSKEPFYNPVPGEITEVFVAAFSEVYVTAGQEIYTVQPSIDKADWEQTKIDLANFEKDYEKEVERQEEAIEEYEKNLKKIKNKLEKSLAEIELERMKESYDTYVEDGKERIAELTERVDNYEIWSEGPVTVYAESDGVISSFASFSKGTELTEDQYMFDFYDPTSFCIRLDKENTGLRYGMEITFTSTLAGENISFPGRVVSSKDVYPTDATNRNEVIILLDEDHYMDGNNVGVVSYYDYNLENVSLLDPTIVYHDTGATEEEEEEEEESPIKPLVPQAGFVPEGKPYVWVYDANGCAIKRYITVARYDAAGYWVGSELSADDKIIIH